VEVKNKLIFIADDHILVAKGISCLLEQIGFCNIKTFMNGNEVIMAFNSQTPDLVFLDVYMPECDGISALKTIRQKGFKIPIIMLSMTSDKKYIDASMEFGANAYLHKSCDIQDISNALLEIKRGNKYISDTFEHTSSQVTKTSINGEFYLKERLTKREDEILLKYCDGLNTAEIAQQLFLSTATVDTHKKNIMQKFGVNSLSKMIAIALKNYLV
jgi:DNA-binding NarL/FixJ family response regulator